MCRPFTPSLSLWSGGPGSSAHILVVRDDGEIVLGAGLVRRTKTGPYWSTSTYYSFGLSSTFESSHWFRFERTDLYCRLITSSTLLVPSLPSPSFFSTLHSPFPLSYSFFCLVSNFTGINHPPFLLLSLFPWFSYVIWVLLETRSKFTLGSSDFTPSSESVPRLVLSW